MSHAFILRDETILCRQTPHGWWPMQVELPQSDIDNPALNTHDTHSTQRAYQVGRVTLFESLAPTHWLPNDDSRQNKNSLTAFESETANTFTTNAFTSKATLAMTYAYAIANHVTLPKILENAELESRGLTSNNKEKNTLGNDECAFIAYRLLITQLPFALSDQLSQAIQLLRWQETRSFVVAAQLLLSMPTTVSARWSVLFAAYANIHACSRVSSPLLPDPIRKRVPCKFYWRTIIVMGNKKLLNKRYNMV